MVLPFDNERSEKQRKVFDANYFFCDKVEGNVDTLGVGDVWLYFHEAGFAGFRDIKEHVSIFKSELGEDTREACLEDMFVPDETIITSLNLAHTGANAIKHLALELFKDDPVQLTKAKELKMADAAQAYEANYFFRDYVTEDILSFGIGEVWLYHYKETLIGVRSAREKIGYFADHGSIPKGDERWSPTLEQVTPQHIKESVDDMEHSEEDTKYIPFDELKDHALRMVMSEISHKMDSVIGG